MARVWPIFALVFTMPAMAAAYGTASAADCPVASVALEAPPAAARVDEGSCGKSGLRVGEHIPVYDARDWERLGSGIESQWRIAIASEEAAFLRVRLVSEEEGPIAATAWGASGEPAPFDIRPGSAWSPIVEGELIVIETIAPRSLPPLVVVDLASRGVRPFWKKPKEQGCYLDVNCYEEWAQLETGIGLIVYEDDAGGTTLCTGSLIADVPGTFRPWFLTAHHCVDTQTEAMSSVVFWNYETDVCDGAVPDLSQVPRSDGASYMNGADLSDYTLLLLDEDPPDGTAYLGWSTAALGPGEIITAIHHPAGTYKRISFGEEAGSGSNFWTVRYVESSTEGGSSGCPLFNAQKQIVGQLSGGLAACFDMDETDDYGKFAVSWQLGMDAYLSSTEIPTTTTTTTIPSPKNEEDESGRSSDSGDDENCCGC